MNLPKPFPGSSREAQWRRTAQRRTARVQAQAAARRERDRRRQAVMRQAAPALPRSPIAKVGAVGKRYAKARDAFLLKLYGLPAEGIVVVVPCQGEGCQRVATLTLDASGRPHLEPGFHVHHIAKRSTHPELREEQDNLAVLCAECHAKIHESQEASHE